MNHRTVPMRPRRHWLVLALADLFDVPNIGPANPHDPGSTEHADWAYEHRVKRGLPVAQPQDNPRGLRWRREPNDADRPCKRCGRMLAASAFTPRDSLYRHSICKGCRALEERRRRVMDGANAQS